MRAAWRASAPSPHRRLTSSTFWHLQRQEGHTAVSTLGTGVDDLPPSSLGLTSITAAVAHLLLKQQATEERALARPGAKLHTDAHWPSHFRPGTKSLGAAERVLFGTNSVARRPACWPVLKQEKCLPNHQSAEIGRTWWRKRKRKRATAWESQGGCLITTFLFAATADFCPGGSILCLL